MTNNSDNLTSLTAEEPETYTANVSTTSLSEILAGSYTSNIRSLEEVSSSDVDLVGGKAANLGKLIQAGVRVPLGYVFDTSIFDTYLIEKGLPNDIHQAIASARKTLGGAVALRSSANGEDGEKISMAGVFETFYVQSIETQQQVEVKAEKLYKQAISPEVKEYAQLHDIPPSQMKMGLILQKLIQSEYSGVIYTNLDDGQILIGYCKGFGDQLADQETAGSTLVIDGNTGKISQSRGYEQSPLDQNIIQQLIDASQKISRLYNNLPQDIEFAVENGKVYILQSRPLTRSLGDIKLEETPNDTLNKAREDFRASAAKEKATHNTSSAIFSSSNFSELLPHPASMDYTIFATILTGRNGVPGAFQIARREIGYTVSNEAIGFMQRLGGRTYYSVTRDALTFFGAFPETEKEYIDNTVEHYLKKINEDPDLGFYPEMVLYEQFPTLEWLQKHYGMERAPVLLAQAEKLNNRLDCEAVDLSHKLDEKITEFKSYIEKMKNLETASMTPEAKIDYINTIVHSMRTTTCVDFIKSARFGFYYTRKLQVLLKDVGLEDVDSAVAKLGQGLDGSAVTEANIAIERAKDFEEAMAIAKEKIGFYSEEEALEIRHPRLVHTPKALKAYVQGIRESGMEKNWNQQREKRLKFELHLKDLIGEKDMAEIMPVIQGCQKYMAMRETIKCLFTEKYSLVRECLVNLAHDVGIPEEDIFHLEIEELKLLVEEPDNMKHIITSRKQHFENEPLLQLPKVIREKDIDTLGLKPESTGSFTSQKGHFLAEGTAFDNALIINVDEIGIEKTFAEIKKAGDTPLILAANQMNLTHDPLIAKVSGLILGNASIVSHGAQRARELGKGALGGLNIEQLITGMRVSFSPKDRIVTKLKFDF